MADMSKMKKWRLEEENRAFQEQWTDNWCFVENKGSVICVICKQSVIVQKNCNLR